MSRRRYASDDIRFIIEDLINNKVFVAIARAATLGSLDLRNEEIKVLSNRPPRTGRVYRKPYTNGKTYVASAPGEPPALRTGALRSSFRVMPIHNSNYRLRASAAVRSDQKYAEYMDKGTPGGLIAPRPYTERIQKKALPKVRKRLDIELRRFGL